jgi:hypothetical protein
MWNIPLKKKSARRRSEMSKFFLTLIAGAVLAGGVLAPIDTAHARKKKAPKQTTAVVKRGAKATAGVTNIADCAKMAPDKRDACISRSAPVKGADLYKKAEPAAAPAAAAAKTAKATPAMKGVTNITDCAKVDASQRDACISRSAPVKGSDLGKPAAAPAPTVTGGAKPDKGAKAAPVMKDVTNITDCAKVDASQRDACISRSAPVTSKAVR